MPPPAFIPIPRVALNGQLPPIPRSHVGHATQSSLAKPVEQTIVLAGRLGGGAFGDVYQASDGRAVKVVACNNGLSQDTRQAALENEARMLQRCNQQQVPNVIRYCQYQEAYYAARRNGQNALSPTQQTTSPVAEKQYNLLVTELAHQGSLESKIQKAPLIEKEVHRLAFLLLRSLEKMHGDAHVIHRDIKTENIVYEGENPKFIDFGVSTDKERPTTPIGTPYYMAPEVWDSAYARRIYSNKIDVWSLGVVLYRAMTGNYPFNGHCKMAVYMAAMKHFWGETRLAFPPRISESAKSFILFLLQPEDKRPSAKEALQHPWIRTQHQSLYARVPLTMHQPSIRL